MIFLAELAFKSDRLLAKIKYCNKQYYHPLAKIKKGVSLYEKKFILTIYTLFGKGTDFQ